MRRTIDSCTTARRGFSMLELQVALLVLGIALTGIFPLVVMYSRGLTSLERRCPMSGQWYLTPSTDQWARKLGAGASLSNQDPGPKPPAPVLIGDDGNDGHSDTEGSWTVEENLPTSDAFQGDRRRHPQSTQDDPAVWTFTGIPPGWYQVQATWLDASDQTDSARYAIYDGDTWLSEVSRSQQDPPSGQIYGDRPWQLLDTQFSRSGTVRVQLSGQSTAGSVVADGVRLVPVENNVQVLSLEKSLAGETVTAHVSIQVLVPE